MKGWWLKIEKKNIVFRGETNSNNRVCPVCDPHMIKYPFKIQLSAQNRKNLQREIAKNVDAQNGDDFLKINVGIYLQNTVVFSNSFNVQNQNI